VVVAANDAAPTQRRIPISKLTDTRLIILSAASQRDDRGVELPANLKGEAARKVVDKLIRAGQREEVRAGGSLPVWRRDDERGTMALCITKSGLEAIDVEDEATAAPKKTSVLRPAPTPEVEMRTPKATASRKQISVAAQKSARKKRGPGTAKTKIGSPPESRSGSKQARVLAMLTRPEGATIALRSMPDSSRSALSRSSSRFLGGGPRPAPPSGGELSGLLGGTKMISSMPPPGSRVR
jgi:hypothetical protein